MGMKPRGSGGPAKRYFTGRLQFEQPIRFYDVTYNVSSNILKWDQVRLDIPLKGSKHDCDFTKYKFNKPNECANIADEVRYMKKKTSRVCLYIEFDKVDRKIWNKKKGWVDKNEFHIISKGCFNYTVR